MGASTSYELFILFSSSKISSSLSPYQDSLLTKILLINKDSLISIKETSKWNYRKQISCNIEVILSIIPVPLAFLAEMFLLILPSNELISPRYLSISTFSITWLTTRQDILKIAKNWLQVKTAGHTRSYSMARGGTTTSHSNVKIHFFLHTFFPKCIYYYWTF